MADCNLTSHSMIYREELPIGCPPDDAIELDYVVVLRLIQSQTIDTIQPDEFDSHAKLGKVPPKDMCGCRWSSCSVFRDGDGKHLPKAMTKLPVVKKKNFTHVAVVEITKNSGRLKEASSGNGHFDLWMYFGFDIVGSVKEVRKIEQ